MNAADLIVFENEVAEAFKAKRISGPVHLSGSNEKHLIEVFHDIDRQDWVLSSYRNHYHALLHGIPREKVMAQILAGHSMNLSFPDHRFLTSAIVGGTLPIAVGVAAALKRKGSDSHVWVFLGDMAASIGTFHDARQYGRGLPITWVIEDNGLSCDTPTKECWGEGESKVIRYHYTRKYPHVGTGEFIQF